MNITHNNSNPSVVDKNIAWYITPSALFIFTVCILFCMCHTPTPKQTPKRINTTNI